MMGNPSQFIANSTQQQPQ